MSGERPNILEVAIRNKQTKQQEARGLKELGASIAAIFGRGMALIESIEEGDDNVSRSSAFHAKLRIPLENGLNGFISFQETTTEYGVAKVRIDLDDYDKAFQITKFLGKLEPKVIEKSAEGRSEYERPATPREVIEFQELFDYMQSVHLSRKSASTKAVTS